MPNQLTRREFLKLCGASSVGLMLAACGVAPSPAPTATLAPTSAPTLTNTPAPTSTATMTAVPTMTATCLPSVTPTLSWEQMYGQPVVIWQSPLGLDIRGRQGDRWGEGYDPNSFFNGGTIKETIDPELGKVLGYKITNEQQNVRVQIGRRGPPLQPPYSISVMVKLGDTFNIASGGGVNFISAFKNTQDYSMVAGVDFGYQLIGRLKIKMPPPGDDYRIVYASSPLRRGVWETVELTVDENGMLEYWLNGKLEARGWSYPGDRGIQNGDVLASMHAGNLYGSKIAKDSILWRGPVILQKYNFKK